jgi:hypothetical protein
MENPDESKNKAKKQATKKNNYESPEKYKENHRGDGLMITLSSIIIAILSLLSMSVAVYQVSIYLVILGIGIEVSNATIAYRVFRGFYGVHQYAEWSDFKHLPTIGASRINLAPILAVTYILWFVLVGYFSYISAEMRNKQNTDGFNAELSTTTNQMNGMLFSLSGDEKKRQNAIDSLRKRLSLCNEKIESIEGKWGNSNKWVKAEYYYPKFNPLERERKTLEKSLSEAKNFSFATDKESVSSLQTRVGELRKQISDAEEEGKRGKMFDFWVHLFYTFCAVCAVTYITLQKVRFDLFCGVGLDTECECEQTAKEPSKTKILEEALKDLRIERSGEHGKIETTVTLSTFLNWKAKAHLPKKPFGEYYKEALEQLGRKYIISESQGGNKRLPKLIKK